MGRQIAKYCIGFFLIIAFALEWVFDLFSKLVAILHDSVEDVAKAIETKYDEFNNEIQKESPKS